MSLRDNAKQERRYRRKFNKLNKQYRHTKTQRDILMRYFNGRVAQMEARPNV